MIQFDDHIFQLGWNHQLDLISRRQWFQEEAKILRPYWRHTLCLQNRLSSWKKHGEESLNSNYQRDASQSTKLEYSSHYHCKTF